LITGEEFYSKAPSIAAERKLKGMDGYLLVFDSDLSSWQNNTSNSFTPIGIRAFLGEYPQDAIDMFNRILVNLGHLITHPTNNFRLSAQDEKSYESVYFYSEDYDKAIQMCEELVQMGWLWFCERGISDCRIKITPQGWLALRELRKTSQDSDKAFLAMWFDKSTDNLREAVKEAVKAAGYDSPITVDELPHNDFIMNKVINMITDAKFVIADLTCLPEELVSDKIFGGVRGGVYFEAGLARGQGKEVIHTCRDADESIARLHFDVHQINTIFWKEEKDSEGNIVLKSYDSDFIDVLKHRIIATVGKGKHYLEVKRLEE
jgi:nucleoside 2-deoxyribosyltransferase